VIVEVRLAMLTDDGIPMVLAEERRIVVQAVGDVETNGLKGLALVEDLVERAQAAVKKQVREYREMPVPEGPDDGPEPPLPRGRRR
jgi:hypothetical protein